MKSWFHSGRLGTPWGWFTYLFQLFRGLGIVLPLSLFVVCSFVGVNYNKYLATSVTGWAQGFNFSKCSPHSSLITSSAPVFLAFRYKFYHTFIYKFQVIFIVIEYIVSNYILRSSLARYSFSLSLEESSPTLDWLQDHTGKPRLKRGISLLAMVKGKRVFSWKGTTASVPPLFRCLVSVIT